MTWRAALVVLALAAAGCGRRHGDVAGSVTVDGRPLDYGIVNFVGVAGAASAPVLDGRFEADGVPLGTVGIAVRALPRPVVAEPAPGETRPFAPLPTRYMSPHDSGLTLEVKPGAQRHDLILSGS